MWCRNAILSKEDVNGIGIFCIALRLWVWMKLLALVASEYINTISASCVSAAMLISIWKVQSMTEKYTKTLYAVICTRM